MPRQPNIGIIGNGNVGKALESGWTKAGYPVRTAGHDAKAVAEVGKASDVIVLAVPYAERRNALRELGAVDGKTIIDVTNAVNADGEFVGGSPTSGAEEVQDIAKNAAVVKAFNTVFAQSMTNGRAAGQPLSALIAGDDKDAKRRVMGLAGALGFTPVDAGPLKNARYLEPMAYLNMQLGFAQKLGTDIGFVVAGVPQKEIPASP